MSVRRAVAGVLLATMLLAAGCSGSGEQAEPVVPEVEPTVVLAPTVTPVPPPAVLDDLTRINLAAALLTGSPPAELADFEIISIESVGETVEIRVCDWDGESVSGEVQLVSYLIPTDPASTLPVGLQFVVPAGLEWCQNPTAFASALAAIREYDNFWRGVVEDPASFDPAEATLLTPSGLAAAEASVAEWIEQGSSFRGTTLNGELPASVVAPVLARNYIAGGVELLEVIACRPLDDDFGLYNGDVLIEDFLESAPEGVHQVQIYVMTREGADWKFFGPGQIRATARASGSRFPRSERWTSWGFCMRFLE